MNAGTEQHLQEILETVAAQVQTSPDAYLKVRAQWRRKERRRRLVVALLAVAVIATADGIAVWALSDAPPDNHVIFTEPDLPPVPGSR